MADIFAKPNSSPGQSLTELAFTLPLLLLILMGVVDLGRVYYGYVAVVNAAREAARYGSGQPCGSADTVMRSKAKTEALGAGVTLLDSDIQITYPDGSCATGNTIQVTTTTNFQIITTVVLGGASVPLRSTTQFVLYYGSGN